MRSVREGLDHFADDAIRGDDSHIAMNSVTFAAIDIYRSRSGIGTGPNHARPQHGNFTLGLAKIQQVLEAFSFRDAALQLHDL